MLLPLHLNNNPHVQFPGRPVQFHSPIQKYLSVSSKVSKRYTLLSRVARRFLAKSKVARVFQFKSEAEGEGELP